MTMMNPQKRLTCQAEVAIHAQDVRICLQPFPSRTWSFLRPQGQGLSGKSWSDRTEFRQWETLHIPEKMIWYTWFIGRNFAFATIRSLDETCYCCSLRCKSTFLQQSGVGSSMQPEIVMFWLSSFFLILPAVNSLQLVRLGLVKWPRTDKDGQGWPWRPLPISVFYRCFRKLLQCIISVAIHQYLWCIYIYIWYI